MTSVQDSVIMGNILSTKESAAIWSDRTRTEYYLRFEAALAVAQGRLGIIPQRAADEIVKKCTLEIIDWEEYRIQTERIGYPVLGVVKQLVASVNEVEPGLGEWAHWGATTQVRPGYPIIVQLLSLPSLQDVTDTAMVLQLRDTLNLFETSLTGITASLRKLAAEHKTTPMAARSNLQQAVPISFGFKLARLLATFQRHTERLSELRARLLVLQFSGAAGTLATLPPAQALACQSLLADELGLGVATIAWHTERDSVAEAGALCALLTGTCAKFALDLKLCMQTEVGELAEPYAPHRGSSSTMPQKRNPIGSVYVTALGATVRQLSAALFEAVVGDHERSTGPWEIEWIVLPQIGTLTHAALRHTEELLEGLEVYPEAMKRNLEITKGAVVSEAVMMGLGPTMGRQYAHDLVYELCRKAVKEDRSLLELLLENEEVKKSGVGEEKLKELCDPANYLGLSAEMVDRVLAQ